MRKFIINNLWWITFIIAISLLISHVLSFQKIVVDNTAITLLIIILLSPFISAIRKIKFGEFEAEISSKEVKKVKENIDSQLSEIPEKAQNICTEDKTLKTIAKLVEDDPVLAGLSLLSEERSYHSLELSRHEKQQRKNKNNTRRIYHEKRIRFFAIQKESLCQVTKETNNNSYRNRNN